MLWRPKNPDVAARRVVGLGFSARIGAPYAAVASTSARNPYLQHCASTLDRKLRASGSLSQTRIAWRCSREYEMEDWKSAPS